jgi:hypothetical protein
MISQFSLAMAALDRIGIIQFQIDEQNIYMNKEGDIKLGI